MDLKITLSYKNQQSYSRKNGGDMIVGLFGWIDKKDDDTFV